VAGAKLGHVHLHVNTRLERVQAWVLEKWSWEEHFLKDLDVENFGDVTNATRTALRNPTFILTVARVQLTEQTYQA